jgi:hypothetical protein
MAAPRGRHHLLKLSRHAAGSACPVSGRGFGRIAHVLLVLLVMVLAAGAALATGGGFGRLANNTLTGVHWLAAAAIGQLLGSAFGGTVYPVGLIGSAVCIAVFLRLNVRHPGVGLLARCRCPSRRSHVRAWGPLSSTIRGTSCPTPRHACLGSETSYRWPFPGSVRLSAQATY